MALYQVEYFVAVTQEIELRLIRMGSGVSVEDDGEVSASCDR